MFRSTLGPDLTSLYSSCQLEVISSVLMSDSLSLEVFPLSPTYFLHQVTEVEAVDLIRVMTFTRYFSNHVQRLFKRLQMFNSWRLNGKH